jgi:hypothetical protein
VTLETIEGYAFQHLKSGYDLAHYSWTDVTSFVYVYEDKAKEMLPKIRGILQEEVRRQSPELREILAPDGDCYNLDLLFFTLLKQGLSGGNLLSLDRELRGEPSVRMGRWELRIDVPEGLIGSVDSLLLCTHDKNNLKYLREAAAATMSDSHVRESLDELSLLVKDVSTRLDSFKNGIRDLMNQVTLGGIIQGTCSICKTWETLA